MSELVSPWEHASRDNVGASHDHRWCHFISYKQSRQDDLSLDTIYMLVGVAMYLGYRKNKHPLHMQTQAEWRDDRARHLPRGDRRHGILWGMSHDLRWCHLVSYKQTWQHALSLDTIYVVVAVAMYLGYRTRKVQNPCTFTSWVTWWPSMPLVRPGQASWYALGCVAWPEKMSFYFL